MIYNEYLRLIIYNYRFYFAYEYLNKCLVDFVNYCKFYLLIFTLNFKSIHQTADVSGVGVQGFAEVRSGAR